MKYGGPGSSQFLEILGSHKRNPDKSTRASVQAKSIFPGSGLTRPSTIIARGQPGFRMAYVDVNALPLRYPIGAGHANEPLQVRKLVSLTTMTLT